MIKVSKKFAEVAEKTIRIDRLRALEAHMRQGQLIHEKFDFGSYNALPTDDDGDPIGKFKANGCGTLGCMLGELPAVDPQWAFIDTLPVLKHLGAISFSRGQKYWVSGRGYTMESEHHAMAYFGLSREQAIHLFLPDQQSLLYGGIDLDSDSSLEDVVKNLSLFIEKVGKGEIDYELEFEVTETL